MKIERIDLNVSPQILTTIGRIVPTSSKDVVETSFTETSGDWQESMRQAIRSADELRQFVGLEPASQCQSEAEQTFPTFVSREFASRIERGNPSDPLLLQVLPLLEEAFESEGFVADPVGDGDAKVTSGLLQKYSRRALVIATGVCGVHCRYCFRREFDYAPDSSPKSAVMGGKITPWAHAIGELQRRTEIDEVILSGGDPLTLSDSKLEALLTAVEDVPHVKRLRIHSRMPIVIPRRITSALVNRLRTSRLATWLVIHCNHASEIDDDVAEALGMLIDAGIPVLNQAVLLRRVNDNADVLERLCRKLVDLRVQPYYLHQLDRVRGASHFEVPIEVGHALIEELRSRLPGYAVPRYVMEEAGASSKTSLA